MYSPVFLPKDTPQERGTLFTCKGLLVGTVFSFFIGIAAPYATIILQGSWWGLNSSSPGPIFCFFLLTFFVNVLLGLIRRQFALSRADLVMVYVMLLMAMSVPTLSFVGYLIPIISGLYYYATPENNWAEIFFPYVTEWLVPQDFKAIKDLHEGLASGERIPWEVWVEPLAYWYVFFLALSFMMICTSVILHRQWSRHERLAYPMMQLPLQMIEEGENPLARIRPFFHNKVMWLGFFVPFAMLSISGLNHYFPAVPDTTYPFLAQIHLFRETVRVSFWFHYAWVGFFYLVNLDITLSIWVFYLLGKIQEGIFNTIGISSTEQLSLYSRSQSADLTHQQMGACLVFVLYGLWIARPHLRQVWRKSWRNDDTIDDSEEVLPYRVAVFGFLLSLLFVGFWLWRSGIPLVVLSMFLGACLVFYILVTRVVATAGVATARAPMVAAFFVISGVGTSIIGTKGLVALVFTYVWQSEMRLFPMVACTIGLKLAESIPGSKRRLFWAMMVSLMCSVAGATWIILTMSYGEGGINLNPFFMTKLAERTFTDMARPILNPTGFDLRGWVFTGVGGAIEGFLIFAQHRFHWWPLHPLGFMFSVGWLAGHIWFAAFLAWLLKCVILKYGGIKAFNAAKPFFLGLILGEAVVGGTWLAIDWLMGESGNHITGM